MPTPIEFKAPFCPEKHYHIVCKSNDGLILFRETVDYMEFIERLRIFTRPFMDMWSYSLLSNHTHHVTKIRSIDSIAGYVDQLPKRDQTMTMKAFLKDQVNPALFDAMIERQMNSMLVSFVKYYNNKYQRKGGLFQRPFKRTEIEDDAYLQQAVIYVNANAQKHRLVNNYKTYLYSSYAATLKADNSFVDTKAVIDFFGSLEHFITIHDAQVNYYYATNWPSSKIEWPLPSEPLPSDSPVKMAYS